MNPASYPRSSSSSIGLVAVLAHELVDGQHLADDHVALDVHAELAQTVDLTAHDLLRQTEFRDPVDKHAARRVERLEYRNVKAALRKIARTRKRRGTRTAS